MCIGPKPTKFTLPLAIIIEVAIPIAIAKAEIEPKEHRYGHPEKQDGPNPAKTVEVHRGVIDLA